MDFTHLKQTEKENLINRIQVDVDNKRPFQGSIIHQRRCDSLIALGHNISGALQEKSTPFTKSGDYHIAFPYLEKAAEINPKNALYYYSWLLLYYYRDYERAFFRLNQFDDLTPNEVDYAWGENVNYLKGLALKQMGRFEEATQEFSKVIQDEGKMVDPYTFLYRGISYAKMDSLDLAIKDYDLAIQYYDKCAAAYYWKAEALRKTKDTIQAIENYHQTKELINNGYYKIDSYVECFDIPVLEQVVDRLQEISLKK
ncbi:MAG: tetratricopeptide repeat protein [Flavobacteriales bacterium]|jgi:tetratricopeptide (TPR) repeat protein|nr:tetratricopeptide repeat protein [Flavobacteriales bacterium]